MSPERRILLALFALALGLRVLYGVVLSAQPDVAPVVITPDLNYAREIVSGTSWITTPYSPRSPGYPIVLGSFYFLSASQLWLMAFFQALLGALTVLFVYRIATPILGRALATIAALWFALHVYHMHLSSVFDRDVLAVFLLMLLVFLVVRPLKHMRYGLFAGLVYAALIHVDPQYFLLLPVFAVVILFKTRHGLLNIQYLFLFLSALVVATIPWTIRNSVVYGQPLPVGLEARRFLRPAKIVVTEPERGLADLESKIARASRTRILQENTVEFWRFARFHGGELPEGFEPQDTTFRGLPKSAWSVRHNLVSILNYGITLPFFLLGIVFVIRNRNRTGLMLAVITAAYFLMRTYLGGSERTRIPVEPFIIILAFYGLLALVQSIRSSNPPAQDTD